MSDSFIHHIYRACELVQEKRELEKMWRGIALCIGAAPMQWCFTFLIRFFKRFKKEEEEGKLQKCKIVEECAHCKNARRCTLQNSEEVHIAKMRKCKIVQECAHCKKNARCTLQKKEVHITSQPRFHSKGSGCYAFWLKRSWRGLTGVVIKNWQLKKWDNYIMSSRQATQQSNFLYTLPDVVIKSNTWSAFLNHVVCFGVKGWLKLFCFGEQSRV